MQTGFGAHADEETLEKYAMGSLPEPQVAFLEEHLLVCSSCQERLQELDQFVAAVRRVAPKLRHSPGSSGHRLWSRLFPMLLTPRLAYAGALAALVLLFLVGRPWLPGGSPQPAFVALSVTRGADLPAGAVAPAGRPLELEADVSALTPHDRYTLEVVDAQGKQMFTGAGPARDGRIRLVTSGKFGAGTYFARLYSPAGTLLREYALTVR